MSYILIVTIIQTAIGAVDTQRVGGGYQTYEQCAEDAVGRVESLRPLNPHSQVRWQCLPQ